MLIAKRGGRNCGGFLENQFSAMKAEHGGAPVLMDRPQFATAQRASAPL